MSPSEGLVADGSTRRNVDDVADQFGTRDTQGETKMNTLIAELRDPEAIRATNVVGLAHEFPVSLNDLVGPHGNGITRAAASHSIEDHLFVMTVGKVLAIDALRRSVPGSCELGGLQQERERQENGHRAFSAS